MVRATSFDFLKHSSTMFYQSEMSKRITMAFAVTETADVLTAVEKLDSQASIG